jgi:uracil-DNA glycosylase family 4
MIDYLPPIINETGNALLVLSKPGKGDYIEGKLLSGKDGDLILQLFQDAGLKTREFSFTSAVDSEDATFDECFNRLEQSVRQIKPFYIIAMGNTAMNFLTKKSGIKKYRGDKLSLHESYKFNCFVYPTYSIDDLRNVPTFKKTIIADLRNTQHQEDPEQIEFIYWSNHGN